MIYIREGHKKDMFFICKDIDTSGAYNILNVFYNRIVAEEYMTANYRGVRL